MIDCMYYSVLCGIHLLLVISDTDSGEYNSLHHKDTRVSFFRKRVSLGDPRGKNMVFDLMKH